MKGHHGVALVFDLSSRASFLSAQQVWAPAIEANASLPHASTEGMAPYKLLIGAKSELEGAREVPMEEAAAFAASAGMGYAEASARTGQGVQETFATLVEGARMRYDDYRANPPPRPPPQAADAAGTSGESFPDPP